MPVRATWLGSRLVLERLRSWRPDRRSTVIALVSVLPVVLAILRALVSHRTPLGDDGLITLRANDVLTANHPWFGTWTSASLSTHLDFNNPSPLHFDVLAVMVKPFGIIAGPVLGAGVLNIVAILVALSAGRRFGGRRGELLMAVAAVGLAWTMGSEMLVDVWQPHSLVLPFLAFMACCVAVGAGEWRSLAWAVALGSLVMGAHLSFVYLVLGLLGVAVALAVVGDRRSGSANGVRGPVLVAVAVGFLAWLQPLIEQLFGPGKGNLGRVLAARSASDTPLGLRLAVRLVAQVVAVPPFWGRGSFTDAVPPTPYSADHQIRPPGVVRGIVAAGALALVLALLVGLLLLVWRRRERAATALLALATAGVLLALGTATVMPAGALGLASHQLRWLWPVSIMAMLAVVNAADLLWLRGRAPAAARHATVVAAVVVLVLLNVPTHNSDLGPFYSRASNGAVRSLIDQLETVQLPGPTVFDGSTLRFAEPYSGPVLAALADADQPIRASDASFARQLGEHRHPHHDERWSIQIREGGQVRPPAANERVLASVTAPNDTPVAVVLIDRSATG